MTSIASRRYVDRQTTANPENASAPLAILTPAGRDGTVTQKVLEDAGFTTLLCTDIDTVCHAIEDHVGALLVAEEALAGNAKARLLTALGKQPPWSDVPVLLLTGNGELSRTLSPVLEDVVSHANVTLLERPVRVATLVTALRSAVRARLRQFDLRDHLVERGKAEKELRAARAQAEAANRSKGEFLAVMSHELRTPLNAIGGYAELIELGVRGPVTEEQRLDLHRIQQSQRHLLGLINQVLNYTKVDTGTLQYEIREVPVHEVIDESEALVTPQVRDKDLRYVLEECDADVYVLADREKFQQIVLNLLTNAIKFTPPGGEVCVTCKERDDAVDVTVRDTGIGIAQDKHASVFEPFVQVDSKLTRTQEGVGLGLAISRDLARAMNGELSLESTLGEGSAFTLSLPKA